MSNRSKHHRRKTEKPAVIMACDWCGDAFAREMEGGVFCHQVCRLEFQKQQRLDRDSEPMTVSEVLRLYDDDATG